MKKWILMYSILIVVLIILPTLIYAQGDPACDPLCNCRPDRSICPIDSYLYFLLGIGVLYGIKKVRAARKIES